MLRKKDGHPYARTKAYQYATISIKRKISHSEISTAKELLAAKTIILVRLFHKEYEKHTYQGAV